MRLDRPLVPDVEVPPFPFQDDRVLARLRAKGAQLRGPRLFPILPDRPGGKPVRPRPVWNSVVLFFNLVEDQQPDDYQATTPSDARSWLDEGTKPAAPRVSHFVQDYWRSVSYGNLNFGVNTPRNSRGTPLVPTVDADAQDWPEIARQCLDANPDAVWKAAGSKTTSGGRRWIPSVVVVQHYSTHASAHFGGWTRTVDGVEYEVGDEHHIGYDLSFRVLDGVTTTCRTRWSTLTHEYGHNFLEFWDLYGPSGCTGYWDLLGDNTPAPRMSEISAVFKQRVGWIEWKQVIRGPSAASRTLRLRPYTTSGEAYKVVPDPTHTPHEYFVLEYRKSTGREVWRPDGQLDQEGLLITHWNERVGVAGTWLLREAPFYDPEFADFSDSGGALWTGHERRDGVLYPQPGNDSFTSTTRPSSHLYGGRPSGLSITRIRVENEEVTFQLAIDGDPQVGWTTGDRDRALVGHFTVEAGTGGAEIVLRNDNALALVVERQAQFLVATRQDDWVGGWNLAAGDRAVVGDLDGDGRDELFMRSDRWAGVLDWAGRGFESVVVQSDRVDGWELAADDTHRAADVDGDGRDEIVISAAEAIGVLGLANQRLSSRAIQRDRVDGWNLADHDRLLVGRFTASSRDEILIRSPEWIGVLRWDAVRGRLALASIQNGRIGGWTLAERDRHAVADLDGDGLDEVYIRSAERAGVLKWSNGGFSLLWMRQADIQHLSEDDKTYRVQMAAADRSYPGRYLPDREGILHRGADRLAVLTWEGSEMRVRHLMDSPLSGRWTMSSTDRYVVGTFQRSGTDIGDPVHDFVSDVTGGAFIHNADGTAAVGVNHVTHQGEEVSQIGLTWVAGTELMI